MNIDLILARAEVFARETTYHNAQRRKQACKALYGQWVSAKARLVALEARAAV